MSEQKAINTVEIAQEEAAYFPAVIISKNTELATWFDKIDADTYHILDIAVLQDIKNDVQLVEAKDTISEAKKYLKNITEVIKPYKQRIDDVKKQILDVERHYSDRCKQAEAILKAKIDKYLTYLEEQARKEEARLRELAQKEREKRLNAINDKISKLVDKFSTIQEQITALESGITDDMTIEEAEAIRSKIEGLKAKLDNYQEGIQQKQFEAEEVTIIPTANIIAEAPAKVQGMSTRFELIPVEVTNPMAVVRAIAAGQVPIGAVTFNMGVLKKLANAGLEIQGVRYEKKRVIGVRS